LLAHMARGDIKAMAACFDDYAVPEGDASQDIGARGREATGMPGCGGPQGGARETCNWIAAAGAVEGTTATIVDRVPIYASPIDAAVAYFNLCRAPRYEPRATDDEAAVTIHGSRHWSIIYLPP